MKIYDLYLILNVFHSKGVALWAGVVYDYVILFVFPLICKYLIDTYRLKDKTGLVVHKLVYIWVRTGYP